MLPFARILTYGNAAPQPASIKQFIAAVENLYIVSSINELWVIGKNDNGRGCLPQGTLPTIWTKVLDNVDKVFACSKGVSPVLVRKTDNTWVYFGLPYFLAEYTGTKWTWTDCTLKMAPANDYTDNITISQNTIFYIDNGGGLFAMGANSSGQCGTGNTNDVLQFTQVNSNVKKIATEMSTRSSMILKYDGTVWVSGSNSKYQLGFTSPASVNAWTLSPNIAGALDIGMGSECTYVRTAGGFYSCGSEFSGQLGNGYSSNSGDTYRRITSLGTSIIDFKVGPYCCYVQTPTGIYQMGQDGIRSPGNSNSTPVLLNNNLLLDIVDFSSFLPSYYTAYAVKDNILYGSGLRSQSFKLPYYPSTTNVVGLNTLEIPF